MKFQRIAFQFTGDTKYAWASGYGPIAENIDEIPFLKDAPEALKEDFWEFWKWRIFSPKE
jgi:hypothetical protein